MQYQSTLVPQLLCKIPKYFSEYVPEVLPACAHFAVAVPGSTADGSAAPRVVELVMNVPKPAPSGTASAPSNAVRGPNRPVMRV